MRISDWSSDVCSSDLDLADIHVDAADADGMPCRIQHREVGDHAEHLFAVEPRDLHLGFHRDTGAQHGAVLGDDHLCLLGWEMVAGGGANNLPSLQSRSEEHTSELQSLMRSSYAVFCLKKKQAG